MLDKLLATAATNAKLAIAAIAGAALVAGGSAVAFQQVSNESPTTTPTVTVSHADNNDATEAAEERSDTSTATIPTPERSESPEPSESPKPSKSPKPEGSQGVHGACVSAVAHDKSKVGREHGKAVSEAAHSCPKGGGDANEADANEADASHSPEATATANAGEHDSADDSESDSGSHASGDQGESGSHKRGKD